MAAGADVCRQYQVSAHKLRALTGALGAVAAGHDLLDDVMSQTIPASRAEETALQGVTILPTDGAPDTVWSIVRRLAVETD